MEDRMEIEFPVHGFEHFLVVFRVAREEYLVVYDYAVTIKGFFPGGRAIRIWLVLKIPELDALSGPSRIRGIPRVRFRFDNVPHVLKGDGGRRRPHCMQLLP